MRRGGPLLVCVLAAGCRYGQLAGVGSACGGDRDCRLGYACVMAQCQPAPASDDAGRAMEAATSGGEASASDLPTDVAAAGDGSRDALCPPPDAPRGPYQGCMGPTSNDGGPPAECDLVCQTGCRCDQRCTMQGHATCRPLPTSTIPFGEACNKLLDQCQPGSVCLLDLGSHLECGSHCHRYCWRDEDCGGNARCSVHLGDPSKGATLGFCSPPLDDCMPWGAARCARADRPADLYGCYPVSAALPDITMCACAGTYPLNSPCADGRDCQPGAECVAVDGPGFCRRLCVPGATLAVMGSCPSPLVCERLPGSTRFGYCR
jgi:hypothetical protein